MPETIFLIAGGLVTLGFGILLAFVVRDWWTGPVVRQLFALRQEIDRDRRSRP